MQGDIVGVFDSAGALVVEYKYDAWGKLISTTGNLADTLGKRNPFRYRGYVYDEETGLYYVSSRYFNSGTGRFVNADGVFVNSLLGQNLFCYCWNNSSCHVDSTGDFAFFATTVGKIALGAITGAVSSIACSIISGEEINVKGVLKDAAMGAVDACFPIFIKKKVLCEVVSFATSIVVNTIDYVWECKTEGKDVEASVIAWDVMSTAAGTVLSNGYDCGAEAAHKTVDDAVHGMLDIGYDVATGVVGNSIKKDAENKSKKKSQDPTRSHGRMPYLKCEWDASIGKYIERVVYPE